MKDLMMILLALLMVILSGCAAKPWYCHEAGAIHTRCRAEVDNYQDLAQAVIASQTPFKTMATWGY